MGQKELFDTLSGNFEAPSGTHPLESGFKKLVMREFAWQKLAEMYLINPMYIYSFGNNPPVHGDMGINSVGKWRFTNGEWVAA